MRETQITIPELGLVAGTRVALGVGLGFLLADRFSREERRAAGWTLFLVGALSTIPLAIEVLGRRRPLGSADDAGGSLAGLSPEARERLRQRGGFAGG